VQVPVYNLAGEEVRQIEVSDQVFGVPFNEALVHQVMVGQRANARQGTAATKTRGMVKGSSRKLFRQKGTGNARAGSNKSPLRYGGGVTFGPQPRDYRQALPKKMRRQAIRCLLSAKAGGGELKVVEGFGFNEPRTKSMVDALTALSIGSSVLVVTRAPEENLVKSARNIPAVKTTPVTVLNILDMLSHKMLLMTEEAVRWAEKTWEKGIAQGGENASL
jgi:large subunit ribosomal protein L4